MSEPNALTSPSYFRLGLFVIAGAVLIIGGLLLLGASSLLQGTVKAQTVVNESVNGLDEGAAVKYRGVTIGKVSKIDFAGRKYGLSAGDANPDLAAGAIVLELSLQKKAFPEMTESQVDKLVRRLIDDGLRARITTTGISGQAYLELDLLDPKAYPPPPIGFKPDGLYIPSAPSAISQALDAVERIVTDLQKANLPGVVAHYDHLATRATAAIDGVNDLVQGNRPAVNTAIADLPDISHRLSNVAHRADEILNDPRLGKLLASLPATGDNANAAVLDLRRLVQEAQALLADNKDDVRGILDDLRRAAADAAAVTDDARQNPARLLFGQPPPHPAVGK
jgi:paraquat-inducible protein B